MTNHQRCLEFDGHRLLMADFGHSTIPSLNDVPEIISWETLAETQQEQRAAVVFITWSPPHYPEAAVVREAAIIRRLFPGWKRERILVLGSAIAVL